MSEVRFCNVPAFDEIGVKNLYAKIIKKEGMAALFPDKYPKGRSAERQYMYNCLNTLHPDVVKNIIEFANSQRYTVDNDKVKQNAIEMTEEWKEELQKMPFISKQKGRMSHLLKIKSKVGIVHSERKTYPAFDIEKRPRTTEDAKRAD